jgi:hypothetical protein
MKAAERLLENDRAFTFAMPDFCFESLFGRQQPFILVC